jgi:hypothetical protein
LFDQLRLVDEVADGHVAAYAVHDVLEYLFCPCAFPKAHHRAADTVGADFDRFNDAHHIAGVVVAQQVCTGAQAALAHGGGCAVQNFNAPRTLVGVFAGKGQGGGAGGHINCGALHLQGALGFAARQGTGQAFGQGLRCGLGAWGLCCCVHGGGLHRPCTPAFKASGGGGGCVGVKKPAAVAWAGLWVAWWP